MSVRNLGMVRLVILTEDAINENKTKLSVKITHKMDLLKAVSDFCNFQMTDHIPDLRNIS